MNKIDIDCKNTVEYENLSYQDFYEDKILLMEYDMAPDEILYSDSKQDYRIERQDQYLIHNALINIYYFRDNMIYYHLNKNYYLKYRIKIIFYLNPQFTSNYNFFYNFLIKTLPNINNWELNSRFNVREFGYTHPILLNWEEVTDHLYINFIIKSVMNHLKEALKEFEIRDDLKFIEKFSLTSINIKIRKYEKS